MDDLHSRIYRGQADLDAMQELIESCRTPEQQMDYPRLLDLQEMMQMPDISANTCLWFNPDDDLMAYAIVDTLDNLWFDIWAELIETPLSDEIVQWGVSTLRSRARANGHTEEMSLETNCDSANVDRITMLWGHEFVELDQRTYQMSRDLHDPIPSAVLPPGYFIRTVRDESEAEALAELHRTAFGTDEMTAEYRAFMMQTPDYDPDLDLVAIAPHGSMAAYCMCQVDPASEGRQGFSDPVAAHPEHQHKGLAKALLLEGMRRLKSRGVERVNLSTDSDNAAMVGLAQSVGFKVIKTELWFAKPVQPVTFGETDDNQADTPDDTGWQ